MKPLTEHIRKWHEQSDRKPEDDAGAIHPSSLDVCNRRIIYKFRGLPRDLEHNDFKCKMFFHGYRIEDWMNQALEDQGLLIAKNIPVRAVYDGIPVEGTIDHIVRCNVASAGGDFYSNSGWCIADTKSVSDHAFKYKSFPYQHHCLQVGTYQWALWKMMGLDDRALIKLAEGLKPEDAPEGWEGWLMMLLRNLQGGRYGAENSPTLFYVGRGNLKELGPVTAGDNAMLLALEKLEEVSRYIKSETYPPRPFKTPEEHPYLCASCVRKGYRRKDGTYSTDPLYKPNCEYFWRCWGVMPDEWSFWWEVAGREELTF